MSKRKNLNYSPDRKFFKHNPNSSKFKTIDVAFDGNLFIELSHMLCIAQKINIKK